MKCGACVTHSIRKAILVCIYTHTDTDTNATGLLFTFVRPFIVTLFRKIRPCALLFSKKGRSEAAAWWRTCTSYSMHKLHNHVCTFVIHIYIAVLSANENPCTTTNEHAHMLLCVSYSPNAFYPNPNANRISHIRCGKRMESRANYMKICSLCINWVKIYAFFQQKFHTNFVIRTQNCMANSPKCFL